jgi:proline iminopeptidase
LIWVDGAGHDPFHPEMARALVRATDGYAMQGDFGEVVQ